MTAAPPTANAAERTFWDWFTPQEARLFAFEFPDEPLLDELAKALSISDAAERSQVMKRLEEIMQEQGVMVQPYWRSIYRHFDPKVQGAVMHATFEHHHYKWSISA